MVLYRILISVTVIVVLYWIWNYVTNVYAAVLVSAGLVLAVAAYILKERETDKKQFNPELDRMSFIAVQRGAKTALATFKVLERTWKPQHVFGEVGKDQVC